MIIVDKACVVAFPIMAVGTVVLNGDLHNQRFGTAHDQRVVLGAHVALEKHYLSREYSGGVVGGVRYRTLSPIEEDPPPACVISPRNGPEVLDVGLDVEGMSVFCGSSTNNGWLAFDSRHEKNANAVYPYVWSVSGAVGVFGDAELVSGHLLNCPLV
jgi:hypothetical protein